MFRNSTVKVRYLKHSLILLLVLWFGLPHPCTTTNTFNHPYQAPEATARATKLVDSKGLTVCLSAAERVFCRGLHLLWRAWNGSACAGLTSVRGVCIIIITITAQTRLSFWRPAEQSQPCERTGRYCHQGWVVTDYVQSGLCNQTTKRK